MTPATGGLIPAGTALRLGDGHGGWVAAGQLGEPLEVHFTDPAGDDDALSVAFARALTEPVTITVPITGVTPELVAVAFGVPLVLVDPARLAAEARLLADEPGRWESDGGAAA